MTIEGGPGWQLGGAREDPDGGDGPLQERAWADRHRLGALVLAAALGFAAATALAQVRLTTIGESAEGVLSLDIQAEPDIDVGGELVMTAEGTPAVTATAVLRNTGPQPVALAGAELLGTPYRSDDLGGRWVDAGGRTAVVLLRPIDCSELGRTRAPGPLRVHATTGAGRRSVDLRMSTRMLSLHDEQVRGACGQAGPGQALVVMDQVQTLLDGRAVIGTALSNASSNPLAVTEVQPMAGLRLVRLEDERGAPVVLPLDLPPGSYDPPVEQFLGRGPERTVVAVLEVEDCARLARADQDLHVPLIQGSVTGLNGRSSATEWGGDASVAFRLRQTSCPETPQALGDVAPLLSEQALHALRRDHPFLTPD